MVLACGSCAGQRFEGTAIEVWVSFEGAGSGAWARFGNTGSGEGVRFEGTNCGAWVASGEVLWVVDTASKDWVMFAALLRFVGTGSGAWVSFEGTTIEVWMRFEGTGSGAWVGFEGAEIGTRLRPGCEVGRPAEPVTRAKVLPTSGDSTEVGLPRPLAASKVLVRLRVSRVELAVGLSEVLSVGVVFRAGVVSGSSILMI